VKAHPKITIINKKNTELYIKLFIYNSNKLKRRV
jgi:hypothetical protein